MNELYHHGVKGMRWGVRRRDYVPKGIRSRYSTVKSKYDSLSKNRKRALKIGAAAAVMGVAAYGLIKKRELDRKTIEAGMNCYRSWGYENAAIATKIDLDSGESKFKLARAVTKDIGMSGRKLRKEYY